MFKQSFVIVIMLIGIQIVVTGCSNRNKIPNLSACINIGNCLEAPREQAWDVPMDIQYFSIIKQAGFKSVRLPVRFSDYVDSSSNYTINEDFMQSIDSYLEEAFSQDLTVILDLHHFLEIMEEPDDYEEYLIQIWNQLSSRYKDYPEQLVYEILNEPKDNLTSNKWNDFMEKTVTTIRKNDKKHYIIVGGSDYNSIDSLDSLVLPDDDKLIVTVHYYEPYEVTFQNNIYHPEYAHLNNIPWEGTEEEIQYMRNRLKKAKDWAVAHDVPLFVGEFGVNKGAPRETRIKWTQAFVNEANDLKIDCSYWEFASIFGIYDLNTGQWDNDLLTILLNHDNS